VVEVSELKRIKEDERMAVVIPLAASRPPG
jgi:hypothetical protein